MRILPADIDWVVEFVNEYSGATRAASDEEGKPYPDVAILGQAPPMATRVPADALAQLADEVFEVFAADSGASRVEHLDAVLSRAAPTPHLELDESTHSVSWDVGKPHLALHGSVALALVDLLVGQDESSAPLGTCQAKDCTDVFVDRSRATSRRFCSTTCQTRTKVAAFRARRRGQH